MKRYNTFFLASLGCCIISFALLGQTTWNVTENTDVNPPSSTSLRYAMLNAQSGDTINFTPGLGSITLIAPLPTITQSTLTIAADPTSSPVNINGGGTFQIFSIAPTTANGGTITLSNITLSNGLSKGGNGGTGGISGGGGGGVGGGAGLYIHNGAQVILNNISFSNNIALGGSGGAGDGAANTAGGGGGGGFGGGAGGNGTNNSIGGAGGGGGGGNTAGGNGGSNGAGSTGGISGLVQSGGGGGGGALNSSVGSPIGGNAYKPQNASSTSLGGNSPSSRNGGGGAGANPISGGGGDAYGFNIAGNYGGAGGEGIGIDTYFGGGGGGGAVAAYSTAAPNSAGNGWGTGGGGGGGSYLGSDTGTAGNGGIAGGGGGGAVNNGIGGNGGFGAGGGSGGVTSGTSLFGGGTPTAEGGGGGAALGGAIFVQDQTTLTISGVSFLGNDVQIDVGAINPGLLLGQDLFMRSGSTVIFTHSTAFTLASDIGGNQYEGGQAVAGQGGLIMNGTGTLTLGGNNMYTSSTTIQSGTLSVSKDSNLGSSGNSVIIENGTLQTTLTFSSPRAFSLTGSAAINTNSGTQLTLTGPMSGNGSLTKQGSGMLSLFPSAPPNTYTGETTIEAGTLQIQDDSALGQSTSGVTMADGSTLQVSIPALPGLISSNRPFTLQGAATLNIITLTPDTSPTTFSLAGSITGSGQLIKTGNQTLLLLGNNSYNGGTIVNDGFLAGNTNGLQEDITINNPGTLIFLQTAAGTYSGTLSGNGTLQIGNASPTPFPLVNFTGSSPSFTGPTNVFPSGVLTVNGSLQNSAVTVSLGGFLSGAGSIGSLTNNGTIQSGYSLGRLTVNGDLLLNPSSHVIVELAPTTASKIAVTGSATLDGTLSLSTQTTGFYGLGNTYTILTNQGSQTGFFTSISLPNISTSITYLSNSVVLDVFVEQPFLNFPYDNPNEKSVGNNLDALVANGTLTGNSPLGEAINSLIGFPDEAINQALDQMHPAPFSAFEEIQSALGGMLLSTFHRRPVPHCACSDNGRFWIEPYGHWLKEKNLGYQVGFNAQSKGVAGGLDGELIDGWVLGIGGAWNDTHMWWHRGQGHSQIKGYYGALYTDYTADNFYLGLSCLAGFDTCFSSRHIHFSTIDEHAKAKRHNLEMMGQLTAALYFGPSMCLAFPYLNIDYFYLKEKEAKETGAPGLNLKVNEHSGSTLRSEAGFAVQVQDVNRNNTMCFSPLFGLGWAMEMPLNRSDYTSTFENQPIPFRVKGWDYTWQLFTLRFGVNITYRCFSISANYLAEMSPLKNTPFFDQRGDLRLELSW